MYKKNVFIFVVITALSFFIYSYIFTSGLFYRTFYISNQIGQDLKITLYSSPRGKKNGKDGYLSLYKTANSKDWYTLKKYLIKKGETLKLGFNMDDEYPSWITAIDTAGESVAIDIQFNGRCLLTIINPKMDNSTGSTNIREDDIYCTDGNGESL
jgi:hypothetical protein